MKSDLTAKASRAFHRFGLQLKKHSPEILITVGVVGTVTSTVMTCKATTKLNDILEESKKDVERIREAKENGYVQVEVPSENGKVTEIKQVEYSEEDGNKDLTITYVQTGVKVAKLYAPAVIVGALSLTCIISSNNILRKRNAALVTAYAALDKAYKGYRKRVADRFGEEVEYEILHDIKAREVTVKEVDEKGEEQEITKIVNAMNPELNDEYTKFFDCGQAGWDKDPEVTLCFLRKQQAYANDILRTRGHITLNDVYDMLDIPRTKTGYVVGWVYDEKNPVGDNYVDFGLYDGTDPRVNMFVNGDERTVKLTFNVDGVIYDLIK